MVSDKGAKALQIIKEAVAISDMKLDDENGLRGTTGSRSTKTGGTCEIERGGVGIYEERRCAQGALDFKI